MAVLETQNIVIPVDVADKIWAKAQTTSALARLSAKEPQKFGQSKVMTLTGDVKAELVGESGEKSPTNPAFGSITVNPRKLQVTVRMSDEVKWTDEDYLLDIWNTCVDRGAGALGRALDIVGIHKINPLTGTVASSVTEGIVDTANTTTLASGKYAEAVEAAAGLVIADGYVPTGVALDPAFSFGLATQRGNDGKLLNPALGFGTQLEAYAGMQAAVSNTVSASQEAASDTGILAVVGDFSAFRWGVQREIGAHVIEYGDPDGQGDLQRLNQIALRMEIVYGIGIVDTDAFAKIEA